MAKVGDIARSMVHAPFPSTGPEVVQNGQTQPEPVQQVPVTQVVEATHRAMGLPWRIVGYHLVTDATPYAIDKTKGVGRTVGELEVEITTDVIIRCKVSLIKDPNRPARFEASMPSKGGRAGGYVSPLFQFKTQDAKDAASIWRRYAAEDFNTWRKSVPGLKLEIKQVHPAKAAQATATGVEVDDIME